jgi:hypothetical protein
MKEFLDKEAKCSFLEESRPNIFDKIGKKKKPERKRKH